jgi:endonuclease/exonuclease/phosphatase (EEP) superfamily protein YafD
MQEKTSEELQTEPAPETRRFFSLRPTLAGFVSAGATAVSAATIGGFLGTFWWRFDLLSHFRLQYFLCLAAAGMLLGLLRKWKSATVFAVFAAVNLAIILPYFFGKDDALPDETKSFRALLVNVHTANTRYEDVRNAFLESDPDFVVLEEINQTWMQKLKSLHERYPYSDARPREDNFGIALLSKHPLVQSDIVYLGEAGVPSVFAILDLNGQQISLLGTHPVPPASPDGAELRNGQLERVATFVNSLPEPRMILGDLNVTPWSPYFRKLLAATGMKDSGKGRGIQTTWPAHVFVLRIPIDHCLVSSAIRILDRRTGPNVGSDHYPLIVDFVLAAAADCPTAPRDASPYR